MATINKSFTSDPLVSNVAIDLRKRVTFDRDPVSKQPIPGTETNEFFAEVRVYFDGGRRELRKEVTLDELTAAERSDLVAGAAALHALAVAKCGAGDF